MTSAQQPLVLVVDDEEPIRKIERRMLERGGYRVIEAPGGVEGVEMLKDGKAVDLLIADLDMPVLGGEEMVRQIRAARPDLKVLYVTAHINRLFDARQTLWVGEAFLDKPFTEKGTPRSGGVAALWRGGAYAIG